MREIDTTRSGVIYPFKHKELKITSGFIALLTVEIDDNVDDIRSDLNVSFIPNPLEYENKIANIRLDARSAQTSLIQQESVEEKIAKVKSDYEKQLKSYVPIDAQVRTAKYVNKDSTKITFYVPYAAAIKLMQSTAYIEDRLAVVFLDEDETDEEIKPSK